MTVTQLRIVIATAQEGSISGAARVLGIPQSNASTGIRAIEKELGFDLFLRSCGGIVLTEKGQLFMAHAQRILDETDKITEIGKADHIFQLRVGCSNYYRGREAFLNMCIQHKDEPLADLQYYNVSIDSGIKLLREHKLDVYAGVTFENLLPTIAESADAGHLTCLEVGDARAAVSLSKSHPIVSSGAFAKGVDMNLLKKYPYVAYHNLNADFDAPYYKASFQVPCRYSLYVEERETRFNLVRYTDAFMIGVKMPEKFVREYDLVEYEYPGPAGKIFCLYRDLDEDRPEIDSFIQLVRSME